MGRFWHNQNGNIAVMTALSISAIVGVSGVAILTGQENWAQTQLQASIDSAALAGTALPDTATEDARIAIATKTFQLNIEKSGLAGNPNFAFTSSPDFLVNKTEVKGSAEGKVKNSFGAIIGLGTLPVVATSVARKIESDSLCVLALNHRDASSIEAYGSAQFNARDCAVQANSNSGSGMKIYGNASATASEFGVTGGYSGTAWSPKPIEGVSRVEDPLAGLPVPSSGPCMITDKSIKVDTVLMPGTYCGGIDVKTGATVTLSPGIYVMKDGPFAVNSGASVVGEEVMVAFVGANSHLNLMSQSTTKLTSPSTGVYKNMQFMSDRDLSQSKFNQEWATILGGATLEYDGICYLPEQQFWAGGSGNDIIIKANSPTLSLIADKIWAQGNVVYEFTQEDRRNMGMAGAASFQYGARLVQ